MRGFYLAFPIWNSVRTELSWTHYRNLLRVENETARFWYINEAISQNWSSRALERQIKTLYYERLLASQDKAAVEKEAKTNLAGLSKSPREFVRDPVLLAEFLGMPGSGRLLENELEQGLMDKLQVFLLELGKGFALWPASSVSAPKARTSSLILFFANYLLKCFVLFDLKTGELTHQDIGQMDMYVRMYDDLKRGEDDNPTVGIILCSQKDASVVRYSVLNDSEQLFASRYKLVLPSEEELRRELKGNVRPCWSRQSKKRMGTTMGKATSKNNSFHEELVLNKWAMGFFNNGNLQTLKNRLAEDRHEGIDEDGQTGFFNELQNNLFHIDRINKQDLRRYDLKYSPALECHHRKT